MIRIKEGTSRSTDASLQHAIAIAEYYGFVPFEQIARMPLRQNGGKDKVSATFAKAESDITFARRDERLSRAL